MSGSVWEWVADCWFDTYKGCARGRKAHGIGRIVSRACYVADPGATTQSYARSASRFTYDNDVRYVLNGFRVVRGR